MPFASESLNVLPSTGDSTVKSLGAACKQRLENKAAAPTTIRNEIRLATVQRIEV